MVDLDTQLSTPSFLTAALTAGSYGLILLVMFVLLFLVPFAIFTLL